MKNNLNDWKDYDGPCADCGIDLSPMNNYAKAVCYNCRKIFCRNCVVVGNDNKWWCKDCSKKEKERIILTGYQPKNRGDKKHPPTGGSNVWIKR